MESSSLVKIIRFITSLHLTQHRALLQLRQEEEQHIHAPFEAQLENWQVL